MASDRPELNQSHKARNWPLSPGERPIALVVLASAVAVFSLLPVFYLLAREGLDLARLRELLDTPTTIPLLINTLVLMVAVTTACVILGVSLAVLTSCTDLPGRRAWMVLFTLPLVVPAFIASYAWVAAGYRYAPKFTGLYGLAGAIVVLTLSMFPIVFLPVAAALRGLDSSHEDVARTLGFGRTAAFMRVTLPRLTLAISGSALVVALHMLAEFGALQLLRYQTLSTAVVLRATTLGAPEQARALSVALALLALAVLCADVRLFRSAITPERIAAGVDQRRVLWQLGATRPLALLLCLLVVLLAIGIPLAGMLPAVIDLVAGRTIFDSAELFDAAWTTARYGVSAAVLITVAALPISILVVRFPGPLAVVVERAAWVAHSLPGVVVALALVFASTRLLEPLYQTSALLIIGYTILFLPIAVGAQQAGIRHADRRYDEQARAMGLSAVATFTRVLLPLALPSIGAGAMLALLQVSKELTMTLLLRPTGANTLATRLWGTTKGEVLNFTAAAPYALGLIVVSAIPAIMLIRGLLKETRPGGGSSLPLHDH